MNTDGIAELWSEHRTTVITIAVVAALVLTLIGVRIASGGGDADADGLTVADEPEDDPAGSPTEDDASEGEVVALPSEGASAGDAGGGTDGTDKSQQSDGTTGSSDGTATTGGTSDGGTGGSDGGSTTGSSGSSTTGSATTGGSGGTALPGVTDKEIQVVYYWRGDRTRTSPYIQGSGAEGNVDEGDAFKKFVAYVNAHGGPGDNATIMGLDFDLHGRKIVGTVIEAGQDAESYAAASERIVGEIKPMAALTSTGSQSDYMCEPLAKAGIHNFGVYDLRGNLAPGSNGYCTPAGIGFERQVDLSIAWLKRQQDGDPARKYGLLYYEYPGLQQSAASIEQKMKAAGLNLVATASMTASLTTSQGEAPAIINTFRGAGVNTVVMPDGGAPLTFTHAAAAQGYNPNYYVWPCSGQDTVGFVRLLNAAQWSGAEGLSCYDESYISDVNVNGPMRDAEWFAKYKEVAPNDEPPAQSPFVYAAFLPLLQGITEAGPDLTLESFRAGLDAFPAYRYDMIAGRTNDATKILIDYGAPSRFGVADATTVRWNATKTYPGSASGAYDFPEAKRYRTPAEVR